MLQGKHLLLVNAAGQIVLIGAAFFGNIPLFYASLVLIVVPVLVYLSLKDPQDL